MQSKYWLEYQQSWENPQFRNSWLRVLRYLSTDRCVRTHDTCLHSIERVPYLYVLSNSHSLTNTNQRQNKISKWKQYAKQEIFVTFVSRYFILEFIFIEEWCAWRRLIAEYKHFLSPTDKIVNSKLSLYSDHDNEMV